MTLRRRFLSLSALLLPVAVLAACSSSSTSGSGPPTQGTYTIVFPSLDLPTYADDIQVFVFPAGDAATQCSDLIGAEKGGGTLPATVPGIPTQASPPCKLDTGAGSISIPFGSYAVLVAVEKAGEVIAIGCQQETISAASPSMQIPVDTCCNAVVPTTPCTSLSAYCANSCG